MFMWTCTKGLSLSVMNSNSELQHHEIFRSRRPNGCKRYPAVECHKSAVVTHGEAEKVYIGNLLRTVNSRRVEAARIHETRLVRPELMYRLGTRLSETRDESLNR